MNLVKPYLRKIVRIIREKVIFDNKPQRGTPGYIKTPLGDLITNDLNSSKFIYEELFTRKVYNFFCLEDSPIIFDCGANVGLSVYYFKYLYPKSEIHAFEPDENLFNILIKNVSMNNLKKIHLYNIALGAEEGVFNMCVEGTDSGRLEHIYDIADLKKVKVLVERLSKYLVKFPKIHFLKLDIEGAEFEVLNEILDYLSNVEKIFIEYHRFVNAEDRLPLILSSLNKIGYLVYYETPIVLNRFPEKACINSYLQMDQIINIYAQR